MPSEKACRKCHFITKENTCPVCGSKDLSVNWSGEVIVVDIEKSEAAKLLGIKIPGRYAINVI